MGTRSAHDVVESNGVGEFLVSLREFSLFLTRTIELAQQDGFVSNNDLMVLISLRLDGPRRPYQLAKAAGLSSGGVALLLDRLQESGWTRRRRGVLEDGRAVVVELTELGDAAVERTAMATTAAFAAARPLLERLGDLLALLGHDVPREARHPSDGLATLRRTVEAGHLLTAAIARVTGSYDAAGNVFHVLWLANGRGGTRPVSLADATGLSSAGIADLLDRLETGGLVVRSSGAQPDGRAVVVRATSQGRRVLDAAILDAGPVLGCVARALFPA